MAWIWSEGLLGGKPRTIVFFPEGARGFEERLMRLKPKPDVEEAPGEFWKDFIRDSAPQFRKLTAAPGTAQAADLVERLAEEKRPLKAGKV